MMSQAQHMVQDDAVEQWKRDGYYMFPDWLDKQAAQELLAKIRATRDFDQSIFMTGEEWEKSEKTHRHTNPRDGRNVLERFEKELGFIYENAKLNAYLQQVLGRDFKWYLKKMVCRIPANRVPEWVFSGVGGSYVTNSLGAFMKPEYRDISYYCENELHQDIIDYPRLPPKYRDHRYITLFVDLMDTPENFVPPTLFPGTHMLGATLYQHNMKRISGNDWVYTDDSGNSMKTHAVDVNGSVGFGAIWHSCLVHGARPLKVVPDGKMHLTLRFLLARGDDAAPCALDEVNGAITGPLYIADDYTPDPKANQEGFVQLGRSDFLKGDW